jgi:hypothetical protein
MAAQIAVRSSENLRNRTNIISDITARWRENMRRRALQYLHGILQPEIGVMYELRCSNRGR